MNLFMFAHFLLYTLILSARAWKNDIRMVGYKMVIQGTMPYMVYFGYLIKFKICRSCNHTYLSMLPTGLFIVSNTFYTLLALKMSGKITYNGHGLNEFVPPRTSAYVSQQDWHVAEMTVRETLEFAGRCQGVGSKYGKLWKIISV